MSELAYDIECLYIEGLNGKQIAKELNCPLEIVEQWIEDQSVSDPGEEVMEWLANQLAPYDRSVAEKPQEEFGPYITINS
jgi:hypothetical protein